MTQSQSDDPNRLTIFYVHGNWMTRDNSRGRVQFLCRLIRCQTNAPFRMIMLSWPSQREKHPVHDIRENANCADIQAFHLAWLMRQLPPEEKVSVMGFSFGGRVVTGALHLIAGGCILGHSLNDYAGRELVECDTTRKYRVSLCAPAIDRQWLEPNSRHGRAMSSIDHLVNLYNSRDPVLRRFRFVDLARPIAAGFSGFPNVGDPRQTTPFTRQDRIEQYDCSDVLGGTHDERSYYTKCSCFRRAILNLFSQDG
jgi:hypothetical protein